GEVSSTSHRYLASQRTRRTYWQAGHNYEYSNFPTDRGSLRSLLPVQIVYCIRWHNIHPSRMWLSSSYRTHKTLLSQHKLEVQTYQRQGRRPRQRMKKCHLLFG